MPALRYIDDEKIEAEVIHLTKFAPDYFWTRPGSYRGYHNGHEHGLWAHTLKLSTVIDRLADSWVEMGHIRTSDIDRVHAAAILHDQLKEGTERSDGDDEETRRDHELLMAGRIREHSSLSEPVIRAVESHMGSWYDGPAPRPGSIEDLLHYADMMASCRAITVPVPAPVPDELADHVQGVDIDG
jgi:hypothetical protein